MTFDARSPEMPSNPPRAARPVPRRSSVLRATPALIAGIGVSLLSPAAYAAAAPAPQTVQLPYTFNDNMSSSWDIQPDGDVNDGGNDLYDTGGKLFVNNQPFQPTSNTAACAPDRNEISVSPMQFGGVNVGRRVAVNRQQNWLRYTEVFDNPTAAPVHVSVRVDFPIGSAPTAIDPYMDPKRKNQQIAEAVGNQQNFVGMVGAGRGARIVPQFQGAVGTKNVDIVYEIDVPARQTVAVVHLQVRRTSIEAAMQAISTIKDKDYLAGLDPSLARKVVNFGHGEKLIGDQEVLRGGVSDIVELRGGDQLKGTIKNDRFKLRASYGAIDLPADKIVGMLDVGKFKPRQQLITVDGEIYGGQLSEPAITLEMTNGQTTSIPLTQISRLGYRKRANEPEEWSSSKPMLVLRTGDRMEIDVPTETIPVLCRCGELKLDPRAVQAIVFQCEEHAAHEIHMTDGSHFTGLVESPDLMVNLAGAGGGRAVKFPVGAIARVQIIAGKSEDEEADDRPTLALANDDLLVGSITGELKLDTAFDTITLAGDQVSRVTRLEGGGPLDVQATLWDNTTVSGQLESSDLHFRLGSGAELLVPITLVQEYNQPDPKPSPQIVEKIKAEVADLSAEDWHQRDRAEAALTSMGPTVAGVLLELRPGLSSEAQQRIDAIVKKVNESRRVPAAAAPAPPVAPQPAGIVNKG